MRKLLFVLIALCSCLSPAFAQQYDLLFLGFDAGETNIWSALIEDWKTEKKYAVMTMAAATKVAEEQHLAPLITLQHLGADCPVNDRLHTLTAEDLRKIEKIKARYLCTGMYSTPQRQIAETLHKQGTKVIACWDNFSSYDRLAPDLMANVEKIVAIAQVVLTPTQQVADDLNQRFHTDKARAMGQPTLDVWRKKLQEVDKKTALRKTPFNQEKPILVFISGYEEKGNDYRRAFQLFAEGIKNAGSKYNVLIQLHPRSNGELERTILKEVAATSSKFPQFFISDARRDLTVMEAVALAALGATHHSTVGIQALFAGKDFFYVDLPGTVYTNFSIEKKLSPQLFTSDQIAALLMTSCTPSNASLSNLYERSGVPENGTAKMREFLEGI